MEQVIFLIYSYSYCDDGTMETVERMKNEEVNQEKGKAKKASKLKLEYLRAVGLSCVDTVKRLTGRAKRLGGL